MPPHPPDAARDPVLGSTLGGCRVDALLGRGGMGSVYRAHHLLLDKPVALKLLAPFLAGDKEYILRFIREARAAAKLEHPNIVQVLNVGQQEGTYFIVLQYIDGESLDQKIRRERKLETAAATRILREVASGLAAAHKEGIIHRDIKPANILVTKEGMAKLVDFGLARNLNQSGSTTADGTFMGTPEYVSPEQAAGRNVDHRTDLYSLGITYYQMLSGSLPFTGRSGMEIVAKQQRDAPPPLQSVAPEVSPRVAALVHRLMQKDPAARCADARELMAELDSIRVPSAPASPSPATPARGAAPETPVRKPYARRSEPPSRMQGKGPRMTLFWFLVLISYALSFASGTLGSAVKGEGFGAGLLRPFVLTDSGLLARVSVAALGIVGLISAVAVSRKELSLCLSPVGCVTLLVTAGFCAYGLGVHAPPASPGEVAPPTPLERVLGAWVHASQFLPVALGGFITGLALGGPQSAPKAAKTWACVVVMLSLAMVVAFSSGGSPAEAFSRVGKEPGLALAGLLGLACAGLGLFVYVRTHRDAAPKFLGVLLLLVGFTGGYAFAVPGEAPTVALGASLSAPMMGLPSALAEHQAMLTGALFATGWAAWIFFTRPLSRGYYTY